jgi:hypothetical protein
MILQTDQPINSGVVRPPHILVDARPLAVKHDRVDPLNRFKKYRGGYNLKGGHYLAVSDLITLLILIALA